MRKVGLTLVVLGLVPVIGGCLGLPWGSDAVEAGPETAREFGDQVGPPWYVDPPRDDTYYYGTGHARTRGLENAIQDAKATATRDVAGQIRQTVRSLQESYQREMGHEADAEIVSAFEDLSERVIDEELEGVVEVERAIEEDYGGLYDAWIMVRKPRQQEHQEMEHLEETELSRENARKRLEELLDE